MESEEALSALSGKVAADEARGAALDKQIQNLTERITRLKEELGRIGAQREELESERLPSTDLDSSKAAIEEAEKRLETARHAAEETSKTLASLRDAEESARESLREKSEEAARIEAEVDALTALLEAGEPDIWPAMIDAVSVESGLEPALGAALGDDLTASSDEAAPIHWETLPPFETHLPLPEGAQPLSRWVNGPEALARRLSQVGVVADEAEAARLQDRLKAKVGSWILIASNTSSNITP